jgi:hypothetical protein
VFYRASHPGESSLENENGRWHGKSMRNARLCRGDIQLCYWFNLPPKKCVLEWIDADTPDDEQGVSVVTCSMWWKLDPAFSRRIPVPNSRLVLLYSCRVCEVPKHAWFTHIDGEYFLEWTFRCCFEFPFVDIELRIGYNSRSPAVCQAS